MIPKQRKAPTSAPSAKDTRFEKSITRACALRRRNRPCGRPERAYKRKTASFFAGSPSRRSGRRSAPSSVR